MTKKQLLELLGNRVTKTMQEILGRKSGELSPSEERAIFVAWLRYYLETEAFDRLICQHRDPKTGDAVLTSPPEFHRCNGNARAVLASLGLEPKGDPRIRELVSGWSTERQLEELRRLRPDLTIGPFNR